MENLIQQYASIIIVVVMVLIQMKFFVLPKDLEVKHRQILENCDLKYASKEAMTKLEKDLHDMSFKIDKIYEVLIKK